MIVSFRLNFKNIPSRKANQIFLSKFMQQSTLDSDICTSPSFNFFRKQMIGFTKPCRSNIFNVSNSLALTYLNNLDIGLHLCMENHCIFQSTTTVSPNLLKSTFSNVHISSLKGSPSCNILELFVQILYLQSKTLGQIFYFKVTALLFQTEMFLLDFIIK